MTVDKNLLRIGLEVHAQIDTEQKLFCECPTCYDLSKPNENVCPICMGFPGSKPMYINKEALRTSIEIALMLNCEITPNKEIYILRKHYSYPDLPNGYQRTSTPIGIKGFFSGVNIREVHIEEDAGKFNLQTRSVDYNRTGVPLIEIVTEPDLTTPEDAKKFWQDLKRLLLYSKKIKLNQGSIRTDTNISLGEERVEIKNLNSPSNIYKAIIYEIKRQVLNFEKGLKIKRETRRFVE